MMYPTKMSKDEMISQHNDKYSTGFQKVLSHVSAGCASLEYPKGTDIASWTNKQTDDRHADRRDELAHKPSSFRLVVSFCPPTFTILNRARPWQG
ncbi:hypothetical protein AOLI_G00138120, partial [Acnodon oligacanthus]